MKLIPVALHRSLAWLMALAALALTACAVLDAAPAPILEANARWAVLPFANHTETPLAGSRAAAIAESLLRVRGIADVRSAPASSAADGVIENSDRGDAAAALDRARKEGARYALGGSVDEWRYKVGVDGEPAVGIAMQIIDVRDGRVLWSGVSGRSGWGRESVAAVAQKLMRDLLAQGIR